MNTIKIYRAIAAKEIDTQNIGCHWTFNPDFDLETIYQDNIDNIDTDNVQVIKLEVPISCVDIDASIYSNCEYPAEMEVVLNQNCQLPNGYNTGNNVDDWVNEFDREDIESEIEHQNNVRKMNLNEFNTCVNFWEENYNR